MRSTLSNGFRLLVDVASGGSGLCTIIHRITMWKMIDCKECTLLLQLRFEAVAEVKCLWSAANAICCSAVDCWTQARFVGSGK